MSKLSKWILAGFIIFSLVGFLDAAYLTIQHYNNGILPCYVFTGCDKVISSSYAVIAGVPISLLGAIYYLVILVIAILYLDTRNKKVLRILVHLPIAGFLATLWLLFLQLFIIKAICFYCVISAITSTLLFVLALWFMKIWRDLKVN
ncbi:MAG: vitamin K epoxide reductase family protein [Candidatus Yanofskybacteria bacterium]|nr:vitamin K epoxide reductase family protein [Candidatus Yanofskybacteria bacterium]